MSASLSKRYLTLCNAAAHTKVGGSAGIYTYNVARGASGSAIITLITASEVGTGVLQMTVTNKTATGTSIAVAASLTAAVTANGTTHYYFGCPITTAESPATEAWIMGLTENFTVTIDVSGSTADIDGFTCTLMVAFL